MDDLMSKLQNVLNDPESMKQLQELAGMFSSEMSDNDIPQNTSSVPINNNNNDFSQILSNLGGMLGNGNNGNSSNSSHTNNQSNNGNGPDLSQLLSGLGGMMGNNSNQNQNNNEQNSNFDMMKLLQVQSIMAQANKSNKNVDLLMALRPLLKEENQIKIDRIVKIFKIFAVYPILKESGLLGGDLFGLL